MSRCSLYCIPRSLPLFLFVPPLYFSVLLLSLLVPITALAPVVLPIVRLRSLVRIPVLVVALFCSYSAFALCPELLNTFEEFYLVPTAAAPMLRSSFGHSSDVRRCDVM